MTATNNNTAAIASPDIVVTFCEGNQEEAAPLLRTHGSFASFNSAAYRIADTITDRSYRKADVRIDFMGQSITLRFDVCAETLDMGGLRRHLVDFVDYVMDNKTGRYTPENIAHAAMWKGFLSAGLI